MMTAPDGNPRRARRVVLSGQDLAQLSPAARERFRGRHVGIVLQRFHLLPTLTGMQNLLIAQHVAGRPVERTGARAISRAYDIAVLRTLGARPRSIAAMLMAEMLILALAGGVVRLALAHGLVAILAWWTPGQDSLSVATLARRN